MGFIKKSTGNIGFVGYRTQARGGRGDGIFATKFAYPHSAIPEGQRPRVWCGSVHVVRQRRAPSHSRPVLAELATRGIKTGHSTPAILAGLRDHAGKGVEQVGEARPARWKLKEAARRPYFYPGGRSPGDRSHSLIRDPVSACRALRIISSRLAPGGSNLASARRRFASSASRSSSNWVRLKWRRSMTQPRLTLRVLTAGF